MSRIGTVDRLGTARAVAVIPARKTVEAPCGDERPPARAQALVAIEGGRRADPGHGRRADARPDAGFLAQVMVAGDPSLRASRLERTRAAAALYAEGARRLA